MRMVYLSSSFLDVLTCILLPTHRSTITTLLNSGITVLCDRYAFSGIAFSAAKPSLSSTFPHSDALPWCRAPDVSLPAPDLTVFLDITPEQARLRGGYGEERYEKEEMQKRVREVFYRLGTEMASENGVDEKKRWVVVDAGREREAVAAELWQLLEPLIAGVDGEIKRLWENKFSS
ncbi:P-loop containing nucleoside triphosphate hydrolase protein [Macrolepiota fuliginosa MF-IS2]|uniref:dTMP kinase n=1 Tax=Macrolepiota fuliginosa MF-IS2 TaxID=1400762 RepID=A0A9P5XL61_9AGAR|nr:P-loop containing nucleoside triphosphate hydrolase protein [Macrolepiota fuliginosa MF-IS2]